MTKEEIENEIEWFMSLRATVYDWDIETALATIDAAIEMLERKNSEGITPSS